MAKNNSVAVECMECGKKFKTKKLIPSCPKCGGSDIDVREALLSELARRSA